MLGSEERSGLAALQQHIDWLREQSLVLSDEQLEVLHILDSSKDRYSEAKSAVAQ